VPEGLLCKRCDVFVGFAAEGVVKRPEGKDSMWLRTHCWVCHRSGPEIATAQGIVRSAPMLDRQRRTAPHGDPLALDPLGPVAPHERFLGAFDPPPAEPVVRTQAEAQDLYNKAVREIENWPDGRPPAEPGREVSTFVDKAMFDAEPERAWDRPRVHLLSATPDPLGAVAAFAMMYEGRVVRDLAEITDDERRHYFDECFKTALKTPLEAIDLHFMVEGLTRASWDQMRTQRTAVFAGESLRFAVKPDLKESVRRGPMVRGRVEERCWDNAIDQVSAAYHYLIGQGVPAEDARGLLPMNVLTRGHWKTNLRNLEAEVGKRLCMFKSGADRGCTIRERVDRGAFSEIRPEEWMADPTAAWVR
jgi:hypothetical protein